MCKWQVSALLTLKNMIGLFPRFGCSAVRGTKTVLAVLAILASVLAWGSAPVRAEDNDGDLGNHKVRVLTQNMYVGASLGILLGAKSLTDLITTAIPTFSQNILATKPDERAAAMAAEIAKQRPDFVALSEVWMLTRKDFKMDLLKSVLEALKALGQPYELVGGGTVNQEELDLNPLVDFHLTDRNAILMRTDVDILIIGVQSQQFPTTITLPPPLNQIPPIHGGYVSVDAIVRGLPLRFVSVHLIPNAGTIVQHTQELLHLAADTTTLPLVFGGDFNTTADDPSNPSHQVYQTLINAGLTDAWKLLHPDQPGFTCCQDPKLLNARSQLDFRIDLILFRGLAGVDNMKVFGDLPSDRTSSGLWPSDHAGLVATLRGPESQQFIADK
jgi:endonuclease/exonuclease/phosphatase family metal-dependent hydrolase